MPSNHLILCRPHYLPPSVFPSIRVFSTELALCIGGPKDWSFSFSISPSSEYSGLISFRIDCFDLLWVQGTLKSLFTVILDLSVQFSSVAQSCPTLCDPMDCSMPGFLSITNFQSMLKLMCIESVMPSNHLIFCHPLLLLPSVFPIISLF